MIMKIQESAENYLETILIIKNRKGVVRSIDIVNELEFQTECQRCNEKSARKRIH